MLSEDKVIPLETHAISGYVRSRKSDILFSTFPLLHFNALTFSPYPLIRLYALTHQRINGTKAQQLYAFPFNASTQKYFKEPKSGS